MKKTIAFLLLAALCVSLFSCAASKPQSSTIRGTFRYMPSFAEESEEAVFYYSDEYFTQSGKIENRHLLSLSMDLALSTFEIRGFTFAEKLLWDMGFCDIEAADMLEQPTKDTIGTVIARKTVGDHQLIAVAIRGEEYDAEWASNFLLGKSGNAKGFDEASAKVLQRLRDYIDQYRLTNNKIWVVGYSRAGAVADLAGVYLNRHLPEFSVTPDDLYIYTFEPPAASADDTVYENIYTVVNPNDIIPFFYPTGWGLHTNGKVVEICERQAMPTYTGLLITQPYGKAEIHAFLSDFSTWLSGRVSREVYAETLEGLLGDLSEMLFRESFDHGLQILRFLAEDFYPYVWESTKNKNQLMTPMLFALSHQSDAVYLEIADLLAGFLDDLKDTGFEKTTMTDADFEILKACFYPLLKVFLPVVVDDMHYYDGVDYDWYYEHFMPNYKMSDAELGEAQGASKGERTGYDAGLNGNPADPVVNVRSHYGSDYDEAYRTAYADAYEKGYDLGRSHAENDALKGAYDGKKTAAENGFRDGKDGKVPAPQDVNFNPDGKTEAYVTAYRDAYEQQYLSSYEEGQSDTSEELTEPQVVDSYHILSLMKNTTPIAKGHFPEINVAYVHGMDSNYADDASGATVPERKSVPVSMVVLEIVVLAVGVGGMVALIVILQKRRRS